MNPTMDLDLRDIDRATRRMLRRSRDLRRIWNRLKKPFRRDQKRHIVEQRGPDGSKFQGLATSTIQKKLTRKSYTQKGRLRKSAQRKLGRILSAKLVSRAKMKASAKELRITAKGEMTAAHQHGGVVGKGSRLPARPFMYVDDAMIKRLQSLASKGLAHAFEGKKT